jgi:hypothetical protein
MRCPREVNRADGEILVFLGFSQSSPILIICVHCCMWWSTVIVSFDCKSVGKMRWEWVLDWSEMWSMRTGHWYCTFELITWQFIVIAVTVTDVNGSHLDCSSYMWRHVNSPFESCLLNEFTFSGNDFTVFNLSKIRWDVPRSSAGWGSWYCHTGKVGLKFHIVELAYFLCGMGIHCRSQITSQSKHLVSETNWLGHTYICIIPLYSRLH